MENSTLRGTDSDFTEELFPVYRHYYERQIFAAVCIAASIVGTIGNTAVLLAVLLSKKLRTITNVFVVNLSISDLLSSFLMPWEAVAILSEGGWPLPHAHWICVASGTALKISFGCSINSLALIAVNRWIGITKSDSTTSRVYTRRNITSMVAFSWVFPMCIILIPLTTDFGELGYEPVYSICGWVKANPYTPMFAKIFCACFFPIQLCIIVLCYTSIFRYVLKTNRRITRNDARSVTGEICGSDRARRKKLWKRKVAVTRNLAYIVLAFLVCQTPYFIAVTQQRYNWGIHLTVYAVAILFCNICINPIIYATSHPHFKETFGYMMRCKLNGKIFPKCNFTRLPAQRHLQF